MLCATSHWLYMTLRRQGKDAAAAAVLEPIHAGMDIIENADYHYHRLLLMYRGELSAEELLAESRTADDAIGSATLGYGIGNWHFYEGRPAEAAAIWRSVVAGPQWAAFGHIAAEAELAR